MAPDSSTGRHALALLPQPERPSLELLLQHAVLFDQILEDLALAAVHSARERRDQELQRVDLGHGGHCRWLATSASATGCGSAGVSEPYGIESRWTTTPPSKLTTTGILLLVVWLGWFWRRATTHLIADVRKEGCRRHSPQRFGAQRFQVLVVRA